MSIGDITSDAKGSGARYNTDKPDLALVPLLLLARSYSGALEPTTPHEGAQAALRCIGQFQATHDVDRLYETLDALGYAGWVECAHVFEYGKRKYAAWNWAKGMPWSVPLACAARHLFAIIRGEQDDPESGLPHRGHVFCNVVMLLTYADTYPEGNDLPPVGLLPA